MAWFSKAISSTRRARKCARAIRSWKSPEIGQPLKAELAVPERDMHLIRAMPQNPNDLKDTDG